MQTLIKVDLAGKADGQSANRAPPLRPKKQTAIYSYVHNTQTAFIGKKNMLLYEQVNCCSLTVRLIFATVIN